MATHTQDRRAAIESVSWGWPTQNAASIALGLGLLAMILSLYLSEIRGFTPCILCWYQRMLLFPIVPILIVGIARGDRGVPFYVLPLSIGGMAVAFDHYLLQMGVIPERLVPCTSGISCTVKYIDWFGFVNIPFLSLITFTLITVCMALLIKKERNASTH